MTNDGLPSLDSTLSSITANVIAAVNSDLDPLIPYLCGLFETCEAIRVNFNHTFFRLPWQKLVKTSNAFRLPSQEVTVF